MRVQFSQLNDSLASLFVLTCKPERNATPSSPLGYSGRFGNAAQQSFTEAGIKLNIAHVTGVLNGNEHRYSMIHYWEMQQGVAYKPTPALLCGNSQKSPSLV